ncbi:calcium-independent phospholipase A2-gamma isoform X2 [Diachasma alloeum]|uniref:calcium-independent phospholipase A2-gamma isoform X2 n=1 Tax=Diachasma alloeum TaxID=454923 RepID=UPI0007382403|nr:calcium-independent phospholipase A2-gamma isoform X2 [Diachasma alloeum]
MRARGIEFSARRVVICGESRMVLSKHVKNCRRGVSLTRRLTESATGRNDSENLKTMADKLSNSVSLLSKSKSTMSLQSQWKVLAQLKGYLAKPEYKNFQIIVNKYWMEAIQRMTYPSTETMRAFSMGDRPSEKNTPSNSNEKTPDTADEMSSTKDLEASASKSVQLMKSKDKEEPQSQSLTADQMIQNTKEQIMSFPQAVSEFFDRLNPKKTTPLMTVPKWKTNINNSITKHSIASRTKHVLNSISTAESNASQSRRIEDLLTHIEQYPEARHLALKEGAITILLRLRQHAKDERIAESIREALAVMGYVDPVPRKGIRILSIDGGGMRGLLVIEMLKKLEEFTGQRVHEMFDYMCGVSTGAILSAVLGGHKRKTLDEISDLYKDLSAKVFTQGALRGTSSLMWSHAYYDTALWEQILQEQLGDKDLIKTQRDPNSPKFSAIASVFDNVQIMAYIFRNYTLPPRVESQYMGSHRHKIWEAVRASAAAPTYFEEFKHGKYILSDGGIMVNNPCAVAIHEAKLLWPNTPIQCVVSFGTGRTPPSINDGDESKATNASSWKDKFDKILASATDTEGVHTMLNDLLPDHVYYRFNPYLTEMLPMQETRPEKLSQLEQDARMYIRKNEDKFHHAAIALNLKKPIPQKIVDFLKLRKQLLGFD